MTLKTLANLSGGMFREVMRDEIESRIRDHVRSTHGLNIENTSLVLAIAAQVAVEAVLNKIDYILIKALEDADPQLLEAAAVSLMTRAQEGLK